MNKKLISGLMIVLFALGLSMVSCDNGTTGGGDGGGNEADIVGTWKGTVEGETCVWKIKKISSGNYTADVDYKDEDMSNLPATYDGTKITGLTGNGDPVFSFTAKINGNKLTLSNYKKIGSGNFDYSMFGVTYTKVE